MSSTNKVPITVFPTIEKKLPTTSVQKEVLFAGQIADEAANRSSNKLVHLSLQGDLSVKILQDAFVKLIEKHEEMRSLVSSEGDYLIVFSDYTVPIRMRDIREMAINQKDAFLKRHLQQNRPYQFNLIQGPLYVLDLIQTEDRGYLLTLTGHELIFSEESLQLMLGELVTMYSSLTSEEYPWLSKEVAVCEGVHN
ncbi:condensation domain-containing protein [Algoriphagus sp. Y33]|uniref:condensation domain-containing protein n=1 Tax=Algoriphagus sp. Y33 TaxID=2772483 RepID=UPI00177F3DF5|nr:condensation domain-containing protein [Algoriphagus sp. Y33]